MLFVDSHKLCHFEELVILHLVVYFVLRRGQYNLVFLLTESCLCSGIARLYCTCITTVVLHNCLPRWLHSYLLASLHTCRCYILQTSAWTPRSVSSLWKHASLFGLGIVGCGFKSHWCCPILARKISKWNRLSFAASGRRNCRCPNRGIFF